MCEEPPPSESVPYADFAQAPLSPRPTSVTVIAVLAIVFGSLGILTVLCSLPSLILNRGGSTTFGGPTTSFTTTASSTSTTTSVNGSTTTTSFNYVSNPMIPAYTREPAFVAYSLANTLIWLILATIAIWAGVGLLKLKPAARIWIMRYAVADLIVGVIGLTITILVFQPKMIAAMQAATQQTPAPPGVNMGAIMTIGLYVGDVINVVFLSWPVIVLYVMSRAHVKAAFGVAS